MSRKSLRQASKEASKQMHILSQSYGEVEDDPPDADSDPTETFVLSDEESKDAEAQPVVIPVVEDEDSPTKKKPQIISRKSDDKEVKPVVRKIIKNDELLTLDTWIEELSEVQQAARARLEQEFRELTLKIEQVTKSAEVIFQGEVHSAFELDNNIPPLVYTSTDANKKQTAAKTNPVLHQTNKASNPSNYQLVMDPRLGLIVGTMTPTSGANTSSQTSPSPVTSLLKPVGQRGRKPMVRTSPATTITKNIKAPAAANSSPALRGLDLPAITITTKPSPNAKTQNAKSIQGNKPNQKGNSGMNSVVDLTSEENSTKPPVADSKEVTFNKLQGKTFPSLTVVARPNLTVVSGGDRTKLDAKVKSVLINSPSKFTEWLIQQGLVRSEQVCSNHPALKLKLGMYTDVSKFPYSGGYVWISECCPTRFLSVFSGSLFEGSSHPPNVILKLIYHWACQTNVQNIVQWVKVDNTYVKGINTLLRAVCTAATQTHIGLLGGPGKRVEVGVISLGTTSQDGSQRQVKVEVLGVLESEPKHVRLRAIEPLGETDRNFRRRFAKILEILNYWVHKDSIVVTDLTVDKQTLISMGFKNVQQSPASEAPVGNHTIMEYLRRIVPRMFQNTLSLLSSEIIQQFLDELVWREWYGSSCAKCFDNILLHIAEQTRAEVTSGESLILRLNKVAANPFDDWHYNLNPVKASKIDSTLGTNTTKNDTSSKKVLNRSTKKIINVPTNNESSSPEPIIRAMSPDVPEQLVPLENYYYGTIDLLDYDQSTTKIPWSMKCCMCKTVFNNNIALMAHLFTHAHNVGVGSNVFQCQYCLSSVGSQEGLEKHISASHPLETKFIEGFVCIICEQRFANTFSLGKHLSKEHVPAELPYQCGTCAFKCSSHRQAIDHFYKRHSQGTTIQCPFCLKSTTVVSSGRILPQNLNLFLQHLQKHQKKALARKCTKCALWFINKDTLKDHIINMHSSQRRKTGLISWPAARSAVMAPKSKTDKLVWEDSEREIDVSNIIIKNLPPRSMCKECMGLLKPAGHFQSLGGCSTQNCQYETCCKIAMDNHTKMCKQLNDTLPVFTLDQVMHCVCGFSDMDGNKLAKHLAQCERKSAYPSAEIAKNAIKQHSMLDVLGLVRRPEEPLKSTPTEDVEADSTNKNSTNRKRKAAEDINESNEITKSTKKVKEIDEDKKGLESNENNLKKVIGPKTAQKRKKAEEAENDINEKRKRSSSSSPTVVTVIDDSDEIDEASLESRRRKALNKKPIDEIEMQLEALEKGETYDQPNQTDDDTETNKESIENDPIYEKLEALEKGIVVAEPEEPAIETNKDSIDVDEETSNNDEEKRTETEELKQADESREIITDKAETVTLDIPDTTAPEETNTQQIEEDAPKETNSSQMEEDAPKETNSSQMEEEATEESTQVETKKSDVDTEGESIDVPEESSVIVEEQQQLAPVATVSDSETPLADETSQDSNEMSTLVTEPAQIDETSQHLSSENIILVPESTQIDEGNQKNEENVGIAKTDEVSEGFDTDLESIPVSDGSPSQPNTETTSEETEITPKESETEVVGIDPTIAGSEFATPEEAVETLKEQESPAAIQELDELETPETYLSSDALQQEIEQINKETDLELQTTDLELQSTDSELQSNDELHQNENINREIESETEDFPVPDENSLFENESRFPEEQLETTESVNEPCIATDLDDLQKELATESESLDEMETCTEGSNDVSKLLENEALLASDDAIIRSEVTSETSSEVPEISSTLQEKALDEEFELSHKPISNIKDNLQEVMDLENGTVTNPIDADVEENIENIQKELFDYGEKQTELIDKDAMDVDLPDIFEELGQSTTLEENSTFATAMAVDNPCYDSMPTIASNDDNTKMLEEFMESIQTDAL